MTQKVHKSKCCSAEVRADGLPDFMGSKEVCTVSFTCLKCNNPCDIVLPKNPRPKVFAASESEAIELSLNDDIEIRLTKEGRKIYNEYRKRYVHNPIKKVRGCWVRVQLWEFMNIFGSRMFMGANAVIVGNKIRIQKT